MFSHPRVLSIILCLIMLCPIFASAKGDHLMHPPTVHSSENEVTDLNRINPHLRVIANPTIVCDGREQHQLSEQELSTDTETLLHLVLNSEYLLIARSSARILSSNLAPLSVSYDDFNGYLELFSRNDLETVLLTNLSTLSAEERVVLLELLQRSDLQESISPSTLSSAITICGTFQNRIAVNPGVEWVPFDQEFGIQIRFEQWIQFTSGERIQAYIPSREYTPAEVLIVNSRFPEYNCEATLVYDADISYNCHSYAWYHMSTDNNFWIGVGSDFDEDAFDAGEIMFIPSDAIPVNDNIQKYDIIVYYDESGTILHSAVVVETDSNTITVQSKWGKAGVYRHGIGTLPASYIGADGQIRYEVYRYHHYVRTTTDLGHAFSSHYYTHTDYCTICHHTITSTVGVECSGPPCVVPFSLIPEN